VGGGGGAQGGHTLQVSESSGVERGVVRSANAWRCHVCMLGSDPASGADAYQHVHGTMAACLQLWTTQCFPCLSGSLLPTAPMCARPCINPCRHALLRHMYSLYTQPMDLPDPTPASICPHVRQSVNQMDTCLYAPPERYVKVQKVDTCAPTHPILRPPTL
jgi:hypothetical protein